MDYNLRGVGNLARHFLSSTTPMSLGDRIDYTESGKEKEQGFSFLLPGIALFIIIAYLCANKLRKRCK